MMNFCTLFDSYYIDKGITLAKSLHSQTKASYKQIAKVVRVNVNDLLAIFNA